MTVKSLRSKVKGLRFKVQGSNCLELFLEIECMARITTFEDMDAWKEARVLANLIYDLSELHPFSRDFELRNQIRRAAVSILSNIAEGFERGGNREFLQISFAGKRVRGGTPCPALFGI